VPRGADHDGLLDLASNDYLGLGGDQRLAAGAARAAQEWGTGATGSRLVTGTTALHTRLEARLAEFAGAQAALVFSSGYLANLTVLSALAAARGGPDGVLIASEAGNHASLIDGCRLARARVTVTPHRDPDAVRKVLADRDEPAAARALAAVRECGELWTGFRLSLAGRTVAHSVPGDLSSLGLRDRGCAATLAVHALDHLR
jgi:8-amino-7-oxononanoate synthase